MVVAGEQLVLVEKEGSDDREEKLKKRTEGVVFIDEE